MAQIKAANVDQYIANPDKSIPLTLLYGPDQGLVSERAQLLSTKLNPDADEPLSVSRYEADDLASDPGKLSDDAYAFSMFGDSKLIRINGTTRKNLLVAFKPILENPPDKCWVIYEGGDIKRDSALRKLLEKSVNAMALPCFQDSSAALEQLIHEEITSNNLSIDTDTKNYLKSLLGEDRRASRNELKKLALFALGEKSITREQITSLLGNVSTVVNEDIIDAACLGQTDFLQSKLDQLFEAGGAPDMLMSATLRHLQMLHYFKAAMKRSNVQSSSIIASARPPIHFTRKNRVVASLQKWNLPKLEIAMDRLNKAFYETRSNVSLAKSIAATTLLAIALQAKQR
jgi:DNA polymerase-3 subunit delta